MVQIHEALYFPKLVLAICSVQTTHENAKNALTFRTHNNFVAQLQWFFQHFHNGFFIKIWAFMCYECECLKITAVYTILERKEGRILSNHSIPSSQWVFILICCTKGEPRKNLGRTITVYLEFIEPFIHVLHKMMLYCKDIVSRAAPGLQRGHANNGVIFWFIGSSQWCLYATVLSQILIDCQEYTASWLVYIGKQSECNFKLKACLGLGLSRLYPDIIFGT